MHLLKSRETSGNSASAYLAVLLLFFSFLLTFRATAQEAACNPDLDRAAVCGLTNPEDLEWLGDTGLIVASGLGSLHGPGKLYLVDPVKRSFTVMYPGGGSKIKQDMTLYGDCPGSPESARFSPHGISLLKLSDTDYRLYVVAHGDREGVEVFAIDTRLSPYATWVGCVVFPSGDSLNSVAATGEDTFLVTRFSVPGFGGITMAIDGDETGFLYRWYSKTGVAVVDNSAMSGPNGLVVSPDGREVYVASWGHSSVVVFERTPQGGLVRKRDIPLGFRPDNLRWAANQAVIAAGHHLAEGDCGLPACVKSWEIAEVFTGDHSVRKLVAGVPVTGFYAATVALRDGDGFWLGSFESDRMIRVSARQE